MKLKKRGLNFLNQITDVTQFGIWLLINRKEYYIPYERYPFFKDAKIADIYNYEFLNNHHLYWPNLDIDIDLDALEHPEKYPLIHRT